MPAEERTTGTVVAIGDPSRLAGYVLAGVEVLPARTVAEVTTAWEGLGSGVGLVLLTPVAAEAVAALRGRAGAPLTAVMAG